MPKKKPIKKRIQDWNTKRRERAEREKIHQKKILMILQKREARIGVAIDKGLGRPDLIKKQMEKAFSELQKPNPNRTVVKRGEFLIRESNSDIHRLIEKINKNNRTIKKLKISTMEKRKEHQLNLKIIALFQKLLKNNEVVLAKLEKEKKRKGIT